MKQGWQDQKYTNKICRNKHIHYTSLRLFIMYLLMSTILFVLSKLLHLANMWGKFCPLSLMAQFDSSHYYYCSHA